MFMKAKGKRRDSSILDPKKFKRLPRGSFLAKTSETEPRDTKEGISICANLHFTIHPMTQQSIRRATEADAALLAELGARTFAESFADQNTPEDMAAYLAQSFGPELLREELADPQNTFLILENGGVAIGYAHLRAGEPPACVSGPKAIELSRLYVLSTFQGSGVGARLMEACLSEARQAGYQTMWLGVWKQNVRAQAFYQRWNFSVVGEHIFQLGADQQMDWLMERPL
jgi:ribosomal protein S18 acetylase RimI-like enzyme